MTDTWIIYGQEQVGRSGVLYTPQAAVAAVDEVDAWEKGSWLKPVRVERMDWSDPGHRALHARAREQYGSLGT